VKVRSLLAMSVLLNRVQSSRTCRTSADFTRTTLTSRGGGAVTTRYFSDVQGEEEFGKLRNERV